MSIYQQLSKFWSEGMETDDKIDDIENFIKSKYNILDTFISNNLFYGNNLEYVGHKPNSTEKMFIHNKETICLLFPEYATRIASTKSSIDNIPYFTQILSGQWKCDNIFQTEYYCENQKTLVKGSINIICRDVEMESILYKNDITARVRNFENKGYYTIQDVVCKNLFQSVSLCCKLSYDKTHFDNSYDNSYDNHHRIM